MAKKKKSEKEYAPFMAKCKASGGSTCPCCGNTNTEPIDNDERNDAGYNCNKGACPLKGESWIVFNHMTKKGRKIEIELPYFIYENAALGN